MDQYSKYTLFKAIKDITKADFINLCDLLKCEFNSYYDTNMYDFKPEEITEGGIICVPFDNINKLYKSIRMKYIKNYPWITEKTIEEWTNNNDVLISKNSNLDIYLYSLKGAPQWSINEVCIMEKCFYMIGLKKLYM